MFGTLVAAGVRQTGISAPANGWEISMAEVAASARKLMLLASKVASAEPASAAVPAQASSLCDRVDVAMSHSKVGRRPDLISNVLSAGSLQGF
jgi:hypothetical protein